MKSTVRGATVAFIAASALFTSVVTASAVNLVKNGSFERPDVPAFQVDQYLRGERLCFGSRCTRTVWKVAGQAGSDVLLVGPGYTCCGGVTFPAEDGEQSICLTGNNRKAGGLMQSMKTTVGQAYRIAFWIGNINNPAQGLGTTSSVKIVINGDVVATKTNAAGSANTVTWRRYIVDFTAATDQTSIAFINNDPPTDGYNGLDSVSVREMVD